VSAGGGYSKDAIADFPYTPTETAADNSVCNFVNYYISCLGDDAVGKNGCSFGLSCA
jgi:hypothetical protein